MKNQPWPPYDREESGMHRLENGCITIFGVVFLLVVLFVIVCGIADLVVPDMPFLQK
jgi:hypothetical protein